MNYGLTIYTPFVDTVSAREQTQTHLYDIFKATSAQAFTAWETLRNYPDFNNVQIHRKHDGDLVMEVYYSPLDVPEDVDCAFHAKISLSGTYC